MENVTAILTPEVVVAVVYILTLLAAWCWAVYFLKDKTDALSERSLNVVIASMIAGPGAVLAFVGVVEGAAIIALLSAIAGYILGASTRNRN